MLTRTIVIHRSIFQFSSGNENAVFSLDSAGTTRFGLSSITAIFGPSQGEDRDLPRDLVAFRRSDHVL